MRIELPLEVLGLVAPVLTWVERGEILRLPRRGQRRTGTLEEGEELWLRQELPTYSRDTVDEILGLTRDIDPCCPPSADWLAFERPRPRPMAPPRDYDLVNAFERLSRLYFQWNGNELCIRANGLENLHELGGRFPVCHLIRHCHSRAVIEGFLTWERALKLPEQMSALPSASRSLRVLVERGLSEGHMHFWGVTGADEVWANHLLGRPAAGKLRELSAPEARLLRLGRLSVRILALAVLIATRLLPRHGRDLPYALFRHLDALYHAHHPQAEQAIEKRLLERLRQATDMVIVSRSERKADRRLELEHEKRRDWDTEGEDWEQRLDLEIERWQREQAPLETKKVDTDEWTWLLSILDPAASRLMDSRRRRKAEEPNPIRRRIRSLERLHLRVQLRLLEMTRIIRALESKDRDQECGSYWCNVYRLRRDFLHQALFRYLIYHTHHMQLATQRGKTTGLREFKEFYDADQRTLLGPELVHEHSLVVDRLFGSDGLELLEGRLALPVQGADGLMPWLLAFASRAQGRPIDKLGLVIHFKKQSHEEARDHRRAESFGHRRNRVRNEVYRRSVKLEAFRLFHLLSQPHPAVPFVVGIDAANVELTTPPELLAPAFRFLRDSPIEARGLPSLRLRFNVEREILDLLERRRLGVTYHVGEDFRHLLSGLRAIYEVIRFLNLKPGDRLGHAIALALEPEVWAAQVGYQAVLPKQEWLDTLVWIHHFLGPGDDLVGELEVEDRIQYLSWQIYRNPALSSQRVFKAEDERLPVDPGLVDLDGRHRHAVKAHGDWSPLMLYDAWKLRQLDPTLISIENLREGKDVFPQQIRIGPGERRWLHTQRQIFRKLEKEIGSLGAYDLLDRYWYDSDVRDRGEEVVTVDMSGQRGKWMALCQAAQTKLIKIVQRRQLVVEVNPSCNRVVGPMQQLGEHHIFNLTLDDDDSLWRHVITTVNTDNPGVLNTSLAHEYYLLGEILLNRGRPEGEVVEWLDWLRRNGHDYTFLRFLPDMDEHRVKKILEAIRRVESPLQDWLRGGRREILPEWKRRLRQPAARPLVLTSEQKRDLLGELIRELRHDEAWGEELRRLAAGSVRLDSEGSEASPRRDRID